MNREKDYDEDFYIEATEVFLETFHFRTDTFSRQLPVGYYTRIQRTI